jgi:hypothetical protein
LFTAIILALVTTTSASQPHCDVSLINRTLKQIEIADYEPSATAPPAVIAAGLYLVAARNVAQCAGASRHFMNSRIGDLLQAAALARLAALAYFDAQEPTRACTVLSETERYNAAATASSASADNMDKRLLRANRQNVDSIHHLLVSKCGVT